jgi:PKD repeat protein
MPEITINEKMEIMIVWGGFPDPLSTHKDRNVFFSKSTNYGQSFEPSVQVNDYPGALSWIEESMDISSWGNDTVFIAWHDDRNTAYYNPRDIYFAKSTDGGLTFQSNIKVNDDEAIPAVVSMDSDSQGNIYIIWMDARNTWVYDVYLSKSTDLGNSFSGDILVNDYNENDRHTYPEITVDNKDYFYIVWSESSDNYTRNDIFLRKSNEEGNLSEWKTKVNDEIPESKGAYPDLAVNTHGDIYSVWLDVRNNVPNIYFSWSTDGGHTFRKDIRVNDAHKNIFGSRSSIAVDSLGIPHVVWQNNIDVFYSKGLPNLFYDWDFGDGSIHSNEMRPTHQYSNPGIYTVTLTVTDSLGSTDSDTCIVTVLSNGTLPFAEAGPNQTVSEGDTVQFNGILWNTEVLDPGNNLGPYISLVIDKDDNPHISSWHRNNVTLNYVKGVFSAGSSQPLSYEWDFDSSDGLWWETGAHPDATGPSPTHVYGDDGVFVATLRVSDNNNLSATDTCNITVMNVHPAVEIESATMEVEIGLRVAGRKFNDVGMTLYEDGNIIGYVSVERMPGSPDDQMAWIPVNINLSKSYNATVTYTPEDPPNIGGNPVWVYIKFPNGSIQKMHHTFNIQQSKKRDSDHWNHVEPWEVNLNDFLIGWEFDVDYLITDPGSDDEILTFSYGSQNKKIIYLCNPPNPDPYPSPEINPRDIYGTATLVYEGHGTILLQVEDDDGGSVSTSITI